MNSLGKDIKSETYSVYALAASNATAASTGDGTEVDGATIDKNALPTHAQSVVFEIGMRATLTAEKTAVLTANLQDSANGSDWTDITDPAAILTLSATGTGVGRIGYDLTKARRYIRVQATMELNADNTDTSTMFGIAILGGLQVLPQ